MTYMEIYLVKEVRADQVRPGQIVLGEDGPIVVDSLSIDSEVKLAGRPPPRTAGRRVMLRYELDGKARVMADAVTTLKLIGEKVGFPVIPGDGGEREPDVDFSQPVVIDEWAVELVS